jgi:excisionase family DNA binding protein
LAIRLAGKGGTDRLSPNFNQILPFRERLGCSAREACAALGVGRTLLYQLISEGRLEVAKLRRRTIVSVPSLLRLMDAPAAEPKPRRPGRPRKTVVAR